MTADVTASIMIGRVRPESIHGTPSGLPGERVCAPSHVMVLMENHRATWITQKCPNLGDPTPTTFIQPASPRHLLAAGILGYTALVEPEAVRGDERLKALATRHSGGGQRRGVEVALIDDDLARHVYDYCGKRVYAVVTRLPASTIIEEELRLAEAAGMQICRPS